MWPLSHLTNAEHMGPLVASCPHTPLASPTLLVLLALTLLSLRPPAPVSAQQQTAALQGTVRVGDDVRSTADDWPIASLLTSGSALTRPLRECRLVTSGFEGKWVQAFTVRSVPPLPVPAPAPDERAFSSQYIARACAVHFERFNTLHSTVHFCGVYYFLLQMRSVNLDTAEHNVRYESSLFHLYNI